MNRTHDSVRHFPAVNICFCQRLRNRTGSAASQCLHSNPWAPPYLSHRCNTSWGVWGAELKWVPDVFLRPTDRSGAFGSHATLKTQTPLSRPIRVSANLKGSGSFGCVCVCVYVFITVLSCNCWDQWQENKDFSDLFALSSVEIHRAVVKSRPALTALSGARFYWVNVCLADCHTAAPRWKHSALLHPVVERLYSWLPRSTFFTLWMRVFVAGPAVVSS